jgi:hypothetical protein
MARGFIAIRPLATWFPSRASRGSAELSLHGTTLARYATREATPKERGVPGSLSALIR